MVIDAHVHAAVAQAQLAGPVTDFPVRLKVRVQAGGGVLLVTSQLAFHTQLVSAEVLVATAVILALVVIGAKGQGEIAGHLGNRLDPAQRTALELPIEVDHATPRWLFETTVLGMDRYCTTRRCPAYRFSCNVASPT